MKIVVTDVSVFFDLYNIQLLPEFFGLDLEIHTTDFVYNEILQAEQQEVFELFERSNKLQILSFDTSEEQQVREFKTKQNLRSLADKTILWKAIQLNAVLLTCDKKLKKEAENYSLEVRGSIWVIQQLVTGQIITKEEGATYLEKLKVSNSRLPVKVIDQLIETWQ